ncbi:RDD family protein [Syntrophotalea acetylenivorans]|uniref:RDD family protein n=1 Tax=Syntrophotalea acetylenivorans TaxID=1842532 RepID=UPI0009F9A3EF|nr:RDD family protein [Syntrophotalea acetylenivorans]
MEIRCPHCGFSKDIDEQVIPADVHRVNCPSCGQSFPFVKPNAEVQPPPENAAPVKTPEQVLVTCTACNLRQKAADRCRNCGLTLVAHALPDGAKVQEYAGFWLRVVASLLDSVVVFILQLVCGGILIASGGLLGGLDSADGTVAMVTWLFTTVLGLAYYVIFTGSCGQTLGKMALRIKVIRKDGGDLGYGGATLRETIGKFVSGIILGIGYLMVAFDERKQGLHDKIAGSYVVKL